MTKDEALQQMKRASSFRTICEVHREIYDLTEHDSDPWVAHHALPKIRDLVLEAFVMGKKMDAKLREYKLDWDSGFYEKNEDRRADSKRRKV